MPKKKKAVEVPKEYFIEEQKITDTLEWNYMPYAMSVIVSRAIPEIDGFKPSHRKLLYTMFKMNLLKGDRTKSSNVVGQTMKLNPHGDSAIYETLVRLTEGNGALLLPFVDSKGNFGKQYSRDMAYAAPRYTEVKLEPICQELFRDIDKETVDFVPNYDNTMMEPTLFPATFPSVLVNSNVGIAVSMASSVCPFNLSEVCETTIALMKNPEHDILTTLKGPDFPGGGFLLIDEAELRKVVETGRGSFKVRSKWNYDKQGGCIEITEIPYSTTIEAVIDKIIENIKNGKLREISYVRDETDRGGLKIAIDLKRGADPEKVMQKLYKLTPLMDSYSCNFNILIGGTPKVMGVREILNEWIAFRTDCVKRRVFFDLNKKREKLHLLEGLEKILIDIDKAIKIVRETKEEINVVPNLMTGFGIDNIQAEYVAEIKLRHLNREYILNRTKEIDALREEISEMEDTLDNAKKIRNIIAKELKETAKKYGQPRRTLFFHADEISDISTEVEIQDDPMHVFLTKSGYFKKITPASLRMNSEQKLKENDEVCYHEETTNRAEIIFLTSLKQAYKAKLSSFDTSKASVMGDYIPAKLQFDEVEYVTHMIVTKDYSGKLLFVYENGKIAKVSINSYETKTNRKKLSKAFSDKSTLVAVLEISDECDIFVRSDGGRALLVDTELISQKSTRDTQGVQVMNLKPNQKIVYAFVLNKSQSESVKKYRVKSIPASGGLTKGLPDVGQMTL